MTFISSFLNSITSDLKLDLDSNDTSIQNIFTNYHTEDELYPRDKKNRPIKGKALNISDKEKWLPKVKYYSSVLFVISIWLVMMGCFSSD